MGGVAWVDVTLRTLGVALVATLCAAPPGILLGWFLARRSFRGKALVQTLIALPMVLPPVAVGLLLLLAASPRFLPARVLRDTFGFQLAFTWQAAALAAGVVAFPLLVRACEQAFAEVPPRLEHVAATLGAGRGRIFFRVSLPLARRGVVYGMLLAFTRGLGEFGATNILAGNIPGRTQTLSTGIYQRVVLGEYPAALALCGISLALALLAMGLGEAWLRPRKLEGRR